MPKKTDAEPSFYAAAGLKPVATRVASDVHLAVGVAAKLAGKSVVAWLAEIAETAAREAFTSAGLKWPSNKEEKVS